ncbi:hypothetical protein COOONC_01879 [Cooperia oncophora]
MILLWHNKACDILSVLVSAQTMDGVSLCTGFYNVVVEFIKLGTNILLRHKHKAFVIFKALEALCVGETLVTLEGPMNGGFLRTLCEDLAADANFDYYSSDLRALMLGISTPERHEISCLSKIFGHPYVDMEQGSIKLFEKTTEQYQVDLNHVNIVTCFVKENFIRNYILRHGVWPPVTFEMMHANHPLRKAQESNRQPSDPVIQKHYGIVDIEDYTRVHLQKCLEFDPLENVLPTSKTELYQYSAQRCSGHISSSKMQTG